MSRRLYQLALVGVALALFAAVAFFQRQLNRLRHDPALGLTRAAPLDPDQAPPVLAFTTVALGSFRGLIANVLWIRASDLQDEGKYFEMVQLADWITKLEPTFTHVWTVQAWNMAYNISVKFTDPADRWRWVQRGIELLRDEGLRYNPREALVYRELAWFYQHKIGQNLDDAHRYYKTELAREMSAVLGGGRPDYDNLLNPPTDDARRRVERLRTRHKLDPERMQECDRLYGPLEWRLPDAHAIYWAHVGLAKCGEKSLLTLRRAIYQSMHAIVLRGRVVALPATGFIETGPDLDKVDLANATYARMLAEEKEKPDAIKSAHRNWLREVVYLLYTHNRLADATRWFQTLREKYPEAMPPDRTLDEFAFERVMQNLATMTRDRTLFVLEGLIGQSYRSLALGDDARAAGMMGMAQRLWTFYQQRIAGQERRLGLAPFDEIKKTVLDSLVGAEGRLPPELMLRLRTQLRLPAVTNAPPAAGKP
jgi:hypothetical protein